MSLSRGQHILLPLYPVGVRGFSSASWDAGMVFLEPVKNLFRKELDVGGAHYNSAIRRVRHEDQAFKGHPQST